MACAAIVPTLSLKQERPQLHAAPSAGNPCHRFAFATRLLWFGRSQVRLWSRDRRLSAVVAGENINLASRLNRSPFLELKRSARSCDWDVLRARLWIFVCRLVPKVLKRTYFHQMCLLTRTWTNKTNIYTHHRWKRQV